MVYATCSVILQLSLERGFRYFNVSPIKAFRTSAMSTEIIIAAVEVREGP